MDDKHLYVQNKIYISDGNYYFWYIEVSTISCTLKKLCHLAESNPICACLVGQKLNA